MSDSNGALHPGICVDVLISTEIKCALIYAMTLNVAKCNLGKVKIEPMLVAGCV